MTTPRAPRDSSQRAEYNKCTLQELGEIGPEPLEFCCGKRRQTQREGLTVHKRAIKARDIVYVGGIPATSPPLTVIDLIDGGEDLSLVANVLKDAFGRGLVPDVGGLASEVDRRSRRVGLPKGTSLYSLLVEER